jgi:aminopeptidase
MPSLSSQELVELVRSVFPRLPGVRNSRPRRPGRANRVDRVVCDDQVDRVLAVLVDVPRNPARDNPAWAERRALAYEWYAALKSSRAGIPLDDVRLVAYPDAGSNNADLPAEAFMIDAPPPSAAAALPSAGLRVTFTHVFAESQLILAPTEFSTTAPLKVAAKRFGFRAATMPGFAPSMIPALRIDYGEVARRVDALKSRLDAASRADVRFMVDGNREYTVRFDLRHRTAHASTGRFPEPGTAGNLPSGEAYIVPYEGEKGEPSGTAGILPVEIDGEVVLFTIAANRAVDAAGDGPAAEAERGHLRREPAYGNMAELGFGVLAAFGLAPVGEILLDEKLGLHVAFGRSEHFGGIVGPAAFSSPAEVIHLDRIYIPESMPRILVASVTLAVRDDRVGPDGAAELVMDRGRYTIFGGPKEIP